MSLRVQIWLLLAAVVLIAFLVAGAVMARQTLDGGSRQIAEWIDFAARQADGDRALDYRQHQDGRTPLLEMRNRLPPDETTRSPLAVAVLDDLRDWRGRDHVRLEGGDRPTFWLQSQRDPEQWIGVPMQTLRGNIARASWWILIVSAALILLIGGWFSDRLTRSLQALADAAPNLVHGSIDVAKLGQGSYEVKALAQALSAAAAAVHKHYHARESWLTGFSHDLRTPIARLKFALELEPTPLKNRQEIDANLDEMDRLLAAFLDLQRHGLDEPITRIDLAALCDRLAIRFRMLGPIAFDAPSTPIVIEGRELCLERAISNLLKNAFDHGSQPIQLELMHQDGELAIIVSNTEKSADAPSHGYGMGLAVARTMASLHGGRFSWFREQGRVLASLIVPAGGRD
ncbi:hypothetical protein C7S18_12520 [Ahniella affigens]|uniref:histidine kinase n=1 Tax=Ahniella affigens TaxID=2021234 RepID=A0A2P1PT09_9GAMM|nr:HAMP domain-containing sensor histidine kinase [Ahniella affigens]AVP97974.1 hypothetical protein C7S18_12520 [Ahniella affigens]